MTKEELAAEILAHFGYRGQSRAARALMPDSKQADRIIRFWLSGKRPVPEWVGPKLAAISGATTSHGTGDEWIVGDGLGAAEGRYVIHAVLPRFIARVVDIDEDTQVPLAQDADVTLEDVIYRADEDLALAKIHWIDPAPSGRDLTMLLDAACDAVERWEERQVPDNAVLEDEN